MIAELWPDGLSPDSRALEGVLAPLAGFGHQPDTAPLAPAFLRTREANRSGARSHTRKRALTFTGQRPLDNLSCRR